ncbi:pyridoxal phosphate-dependent transferase [Earliella scabrosa]|nr:pyridoxal phosphate-dependent transferase [Earliella scabrosa]
MLSSGRARLRSSGAVLVAGHTGGNVKGSTSFRSSLSTAVLSRESSPTHNGASRSAHKGTRSPSVSLTQSQSRNMASTSAQSHASLVEFGQKHVTKGLGRVVDAVLAKGEGSYVTLGDGRKMLDFTCGIGVTNLGHCHPKISKAAADQCMNMVHAQCSIGFHEPYLQLIKRLLPMMPHPSLDSFFFWNSGSEAVEGAIKMARVLTGRQNIISMQGAYHGRTFGAMAVTKSKTIYSEGVHPLMPGVYALPFPYWHQLGMPPDTPSSKLSEMCLNQLSLLLSQVTTPQDTAAIIIEPVIGEGGYVPAPDEFLQGLRDVCDQHGILLIIDEVQAGFGRTGKNYSIEYSGVRPDILLTAKGLANGFPLSAIISRKELTDKLKPGSMGGTYAGNAVSCAAAVAAAEVMQEEKILDNVNARSQELFAALHELRAKPELAPAILDVRGRGLMVAVEFASPAGTGPYDAFRNASVPEKLASRVAKRCVEKGLLILTTSVYEVIRFIPPLNITKEDLAKGCAIFAEAVEEVVREG